MGKMFGVSLGYFKEPIVLPYFALACSIRYEDISLPSILALRDLLQFFDDILGEVTFGSSLIKAESSFPQPLSNLSWFGTKPADGKLMQVSLESRPR